MNEEGEARALHSSCWLCDQKAAHSTACPLRRLLIPLPVHSPHLDAWILLPPGGDFQYGTVVPGGFVKAQL